MKSKTFNNKTKATEGGKHEEEEEEEKEIQQTHLVQIDVMNKDDFSETHPVTCNGTEMCRECTTAVQPTNTRANCVDIKRQQNI